MKKIITFALAACCVLAAFSIPAAALEYTFDGADGGSFAEPTSESTVYVDTGEGANIDRSKTAAVIPPAFGSPTSYTLNAGEYLTPNLVNQNRQTVTATVNNSTGITVLPSSTLDSVSNPFTVSTGNYAAYTGYTAPAYTDVTGDLYYSDGSIGTLKISTIGLTVNVYQGTDNNTLARGAGHFTDTSIWDGNIAIAGHNRGVTNHFGKIHTLNVGDEITLTTKLGTRTYAVYSVAKIAVDDGSVLDSTAENIITLITCVMDQPSYRWCIKAAEKV